jgi:hypothetical protein
MENFSEQAGDDCQSSGAAEPTDKPAYRFEASATARPAGVPKTWKDKAGVVYPFMAAWHYRNAGGEPVGIVARFDNGDAKAVIPYFKAAGGGKFKAGGPAEPVLFGAERLNGHKAAALVVEGEKAAAALHSLDLLAVSAQGGANNAEKGAWHNLLGVPGVVFLPDNDLPGMKYCREAAAALVACATPDSPCPELKLLRLPGLPLKGDVCDWLAERLPDWNQIDPVPAERRDELRAELLTLLEQAEPIPADWLKPPSAFMGGQGGEADAAKKPFGNLYVEQPDGGGITWIYEDAKGNLQEQPLCNFTAKIIEELAQDDGLSTTLLYRLTGCHDGKELPQIDMTYEQFIGMAWAAKQWKSGCCLEPGNGIKDALRAAIQTISNKGGDVERRTLYTQTGWRKIGGDWVYLHGGGGLGATGPVAGIETDLGDYARYTLPDPSKTAKERLQAAQASSGYLSLASLEISLPLLACAFLAPLAQALKVDFTLWLEAPSQSQKSSIAAVALAHFGAAMDRACLTANWTATANSLEATLFTLADSLAVVDDYAPQPSSAEQAKLDAVAARLVRSAGNLQGRARLNSDCSQKATKYPRGLTIATAEQWISGESLNARLFGVSLHRGDVDLSQLTIMQRAAREAMLARCMADFIQDLAADKDAKVSKYQDLLLTFREQALSAGLSGRSPEQVAFLLLGAMLAANHYRAAGVAVDVTGWQDCLFGLAKRHAAHVLESQPADRFRNALREILASGGAYLEAVDTDGGAVHSLEVQRGRQVGWQNSGKGEIYLLSAPVLECVNEALRKGDAALNIKPAALWRQCQQRGWLKCGDPQPDGGMRTSQLRWLNSKAVRVLVFDLEKMLEDG